MGAWALAAVAFVILAFAALSARLDRLLVTPAMFFTVAGLIAGPGLGLIDLQVKGEPMKLLAEATLTLVLFADASRISLRSLRQEYSVPLRLLGIGLPLTIVAGTLVGVPVISQLSWPEALVLAVTLASTDAALGQAVVTDERLPSRIRQGLNVESGLNDGICVPLFFIAVGLAEADADTTSVHSAVQLVLEQIGYGALGGLIAGVGAAVVERQTVKRGWTESSWLQVYTFAAAVFAAGLAIGLGGSMFIAAFVGGLLFGALRQETGGEVAHLLEQGGDVLNAATFIVFGAIVLGPALHHLDWNVVAYAVLSLTVVRMIPVAVAMIGTHARPPTVAFLGWSGPRGLASIVFGVLVADEVDLPYQQDILLAVAVTVTLSILAHGLTAQPLTDRYVRWYEAGRPPMEGRPAAEHRLRAPLSSRARTRARPSPRPEPASPPR